MVKPARPILFQIYSRFDLIIFIDEQEDGGLGVAKVRHPPVARLPEIMQELVAGDPGIRLQFLSHGGQGRAHKPLVSWMRCPFICLAALGTAGRWPAYLMQVPGQYLRRWMANPRMDLHGASWLAMKLRYK